MDGQQEARVEEVYLGANGVASAWKMKDEGTWRFEGKEGGRPGAAVVYGDQRCDHRAMREPGERRLMGVATP